MSSIDLDTVRRVIAADQGLASISTVRADGTPHSSLVNAGIVDHPTGSGPVAAFVTAGRVKLDNLRSRPAVSVLWRDGWSWVGIEGRSEIVGPDDTLDGIDAESLRLLLRDIYTAAGGTHSDWEEYDRVMHEERRAAVLVAPRKIHGIV